MSPRLFLHAMSVEARKRMSYRADFWITAVAGFAAEFGVAWFLWRAVFAATGESTIGGYSRDGMVLYYVAVTLLGKLVRGPEYEGVISQDIYDGGLSRYLLYPASYFAFKYAQLLGALLPAFLQFVLFGVWFPLFMGAPDDVSLSAASLAMGFGATLAANLLHFLLTVPIQAVAFWADNVWSLSVALRFVAGLLGGSLLPLSVFSPWARDALAWLPFPLLFDFPANSLLGRLSPEAWARGMALAGLWAVVFAALGRAVWRRGDLRYTGVGM
ncbi:MAG: ABC transporter permease [Planctomycetota bacterium]